jgi:hypothetical protein
MFSNGVYADQKTRKRVPALHTISENKAHVEINVLPAYIIPAVCAKAIGSGVAHTEYAKCNHRV